MEQVSFLSAIFLIILGQMQGFSALTPVFVQTGKDVVLDVNGADCTEDSPLIIWKFNQIDVLVRITCNNGGEPTVKKFKYQERTEITEKTSLKLKNCQKSFSGGYLVTRSSSEEKTLVEYNVTVEDPVSPVHFKVDSMLNSSNFCNLTVTCSTDHSSVRSSFTCGNKSCKQNDGQQTKITKQGNLLHVYLSDELVICNHSNQVSWANSTMEVKLICPQYDDGKAENSRPYILVLTPIALVILLVVVGIVVWKKKWIEACGSADLPTRADEPTGPEDAVIDNCKSIYSVVKPHSQTASPLTETKNTPESIYAQVEKSRGTPQMPDVCTALN